MRKLVALVGFVAAAGLAALAAGLGPGDPTVREFRGFVLPAQQAELSAPIEEILLTVEVEESQRVSKDQVLARLDYRLQEVVVDAAKVRAASTAEIKRAELDIEDAQLTFDRISAAYEKSAANEMEVRRAEILLNEAKASHEAAQENHVLAGVNLRLEEARLERYNVRAPFDGTVIEIVADPGERLTDADNVVLNLADLDTLEAHIDVPIELYGKLEIGRSYTLTAGEPVNRELAWTLKTVNPLIDTASRTFHCVLTLGNPGGQLPAGFTVAFRWPN